MPFDSETSHVHLIWKISSAFQVGIIIVHETNQLDFFKKKIETSQNGSEWSLLADWAGGGLIVDIFGAYKNKLFNILVQSLHLQLLDPF